MNLNADFTKRAVVHAAKLDWKASPMPGVERRMLDRIGDEVACAASTRNSSHSHIASAARAASKIVEAASRTLPYNAKRAAVALPPYR
jgi:anti-sigma factor ChrR (cupin superfamily)